MSFYLLKGIFIGLLVCIVFEEQKYRGISLQSQNQFDVIVLNVSLFSCLHPYFSWDRQNEKHSKLVRPTSQRCKKLIINSLTLNSLLAHHIFAGVGKIHTS